MAEDSRTQHALLVTLEGVRVSQSWTMTPVEWTGGRRGFLEEGEGRGKGQRKTREEGEEWEVRACEEEGSRTAPLS